MAKGIVFDEEHHEFTAPDGEAAIELATVDRPLSMIVQVTRRCPLKCAFCSESEKIRDPTFEALEKLSQKLTGVERIYLSGGEPLVRKDIYQLIDLYKARFKIVGLPTNCMYISKDVAERLRGRVSYINAGLDGPRNVNDRVRGAYDKIIRGLMNLRDSGIEVSLSTVILRETLPHLHYVVAVADTLGITKVKFVIPVPRGRAISLRPEDYASSEEIAGKFTELVSLKRELGWRPRMKFTFWDANTEGYALLVYPTQDVFAWPVLGAPDSVVRLGNLESESLADIWERYPYKLNHIRKYTGLTMHKA